MANQYDYEQALLSAIDYIVNNRVENIDRDKTITATIVSCNNALTREYSIQYNNGYITAYAQEGASYSANQTVYVLVPLGDFSKKKTIVGLASNVSDDNNLTFVSSVLNDYNMIGQNVISDPDNNTPIGLNSYLKEDYVLLYDRSLEGQNLVEINQDDFLSYVKNADALAIEATFQTRLPRAHYLSKTGLYGVQFVLAFQDQDQPDAVKHVSYALDTNNMTGNPLLYTSQTNQYAVYPIDSENFLYIESILAYSQDFVTESDNNQANLWGDDIFIKEFEIYGLQEISATNGDYTLRLSTPQGAVFHSLLSTESLQVVGTTTYQINTDISDSTTYYWFAKDDRVSSISEDYQMYGGAGWRYLRDIGNNKTMTALASENRAYENKYLVVAVYKESVILKQEFTLFNEAARRDIEIESNLGLKFSFDRGTPTLTCMVNGKASDFEENHADELFSFAWSKIDETGTVTALVYTYDELKEQYEQGIKDGIGYSALASLKNQMLLMEGVEFDRNVLKYPVKQIDSSATFSCSVYLRENADAQDYFIGSAQITLQNDLIASPTDYYILIENGDQVFQYSESGVSPASDRYTDPLEVKPLECHFYDPAGLEVNADTYSVKWVVPTSDSLIVMPQEGMATNPANGRIEWYTQSVYPTMIAESYDYQALNNQVTCVVTYNGQDYQQDTDFLFVKVGDNGTNGTDVVGKISPVADPDDGLLALELHTNQNPVWNNGRSISEQALQFELYKRNELLSISTVSWSMAGGNSQSKQMSVNNGVISWSPKTTNGTYFTNLIVKAQTTFESQMYYAFYPVPVIDYRASGYEIVLDRYKTLKNIVYNADGRNPLYNKNQGVFFTIPALGQDRYVRYIAEGGLNDDSTTAAIRLSFTKNDSVGATSSIAGTLAAGEEAAVYVLPDDVYDGAYCNNRVHVKIYTSQNVEEIGGNPESEFYVPIHMSLNTFGLSSLNAWDGNHVEINEDENYILAPQIGAGLKDNNNRFTGVVMGKAQTYDAEDVTVGLLGYSAGKQSIFLDAETGNATFGLPEDQASTNNAYTEGRIELRPGGTSKIGAWNIGSRALYNMVDPDTGGSAQPADITGTYATSEYRVNGAQFMVPPDAQGVILNANPAYFSVKGMPLNADNSHIDWDAAQTILKQGDSLEVELDPGKSSVFSIYRHTQYNEQGVYNGTWRRYPLVGINANGQFFTNAIEDGESSMGIGVVGAFGSSAADGRYIGGHFDYGGSTIFKFFVDDDTSNIISRPLYITAGTNTANEYPRVMNLYGSSIRLYANSTGTSASKIQKTSEQRLILSDSTSTPSYFGNNDSYVQVPNVSSGTMTFRTNGNLNISQSSNSGRTATFNFGTVSKTVEDTSTVRLNTTGSRTQTALTASVLGGITVSGFSNLNMTTDSGAGSWRISALSAGTTTGVDGGSVTNSQIYLGNSVARFELNNSTISKWVSSRGLRMTSSGGNGIGISSSQGSINLDASWSGASSYLHLTPASDGNSSFYLNSGLGAVRSVGTAQGFSRNGVQITNGVFTNWAQITSTISGSNDSIQAIRDIRSTNGWMYGGNFSFNSSQSWTAHGGTYNSTSLVQHLAWLYSLVNDAYNRADAAYNRAKSYFDSNITPYATRSWVDANYVTGSSSQFVRVTTFNSHTHSTVNRETYSVVGWRGASDGEGGYIPTRFANLTSFNTGTPS